VKEEGGGVVRRRTCLESVKENGCEDLCFYLGLSISTSFKLSSDIEGKSVLIGVQILHQSLIIY